MYRECLGLVVDALDDYMVELYGDRSAKRLYASLFECFCYLIDLYFDQDEVAA